MHRAEFRDPRLVEVYDAECPWGPDDDFFLSVVGTAPVRVLDLGCGTGRLALALAAAGYTVTGVDPAAASLTAARAKPGAERITWIPGTSSVIPTGAFDVAVMTSHAAQFLVTDDERDETFADLHRALVPGGRERGWGLDRGVGGRERRRVLHPPLRLPRRRGAHEHGVAAVPQ